MLRDCVPGEWGSEQMSHSPALPSTYTHVIWAALLCVILGTRVPFPFLSAGLTSLPQSPHSQYFLQLFSITANWTLRTGGRIFFNQLDSRPLTGEFQSATLCQAQKGQPVLFSYEQAQYGVWTYNLTSLWMECDFFFYIVVCSRGLIENSPCILLYCSRKLNSTLPTKAWKCSWTFFQEKPFKPDYFSK